MSSVIGSVCETAYKDRGDTWGGLRWVTGDQWSQVPEQIGGVYALGYDHAVRYGDIVPGAYNRHLSGNVGGPGDQTGFIRITVRLAPSVSLEDANRWEFDPAVLLAHILRKQQELLDIITREGGFYADVYALTSTERGKQALMALLPEAFHGVEEEIQAVYARGEEAVIAPQIAV